MAAVNAAVMPSSVTLQPLSFSISSPKPVTQSISSRRRRLSSKEPNCGSR